ncbi:hypothetical protein JCM10212_006074 [Sporobolomyces blumeae]
MSSPENDNDRSTDGTKQVQNEACVACRACKRRCWHDGPGVTCARCIKLGLECVYRQEKRGRKPGTFGPRKRAAIEAASTHSAESFSTSPSRGQSPVASSSNRPSSRDWLSDELMANHRSQIPHESRRYVPSNPFQAPPRSEPSLPSVPSLFQPPPNLPSHLSPALPDPQQFPPFNSYSNPRPLDHPLNSLPPIQPLSNPTPSSSSAPSPSAPTVPNPATGGFSLRKLLGEHAEGSQEPQRQSLADAFALDDCSKKLGKLPERVFEDVVTVGIVPVEMLDGLFAFYFAHLNPMTSVLDPVLHTVAFCRAHSPFLVTAIVTVAAKVNSTSLYPACLKYAKSLLAQAFEHGVNNLELVQAISTLAFWQEPTDDSGGRKLAYAIRSAFELNLFKPQKRPLPEDEMARRLALNGERTWLYLTIADHRCSTQRGLPKMIPNEYRVDAVPWILEHGEDFCPDEHGLAPLLQLGRLLDLFEILTSHEGGQLPSIELLRSLERELADWTRHWSLEKPCIRLQPSQSSLVRFYSRVFRFQLDEVNLFIATKQRQDLTNAVVYDARSSPVLIFGSCIRGAIAVLDCMSDELRYMVYSFDTMWVGAASAAIWLCQNIVGMDLDDRNASISAITRLKDACDPVSPTGQGMAAYTSRLLAHLLGKIDAAAHQDVATTGAPHVPAPTHQAPALNYERSNQAFGGASGGILGGRTTSTSVDQPPPPPQEQQHLAMPYHASPHLGPNGPPRASPMTSGGPVHASHSRQGSNPSGGTGGFLGSFAPTLPHPPHPPPPPTNGENLYPAADDALWQSLFPFLPVDSQPSH